MKGQMYCIRIKKKGRREADKASVVLWETKLIGSKLIINTGICHYSCELSDFFLMLSDVIKPEESKYYYPMEKIVKQKSRSISRKGKKKNRETG